VKCKNSALEIMTLKNTITTLTALLSLTISSMATGLGGQLPVVPVVKHPSALPPTVDAGIFDTTHTFDKSHNFAFEQLWVYWDKYNEAGKHYGLLSKLQTIAARGRTPIVAIEPWTVKSIGTDDTLLTDIAAGKYDSLITHLAKEVNSLGKPVYIRWGSEMEFNHDYPWQSKPAGDYIAAFRHFTQLFKQFAPTSVSIWAPVGNIGLEAYYPGDDVVDYVGFSLFEVPASSTLWFGHPMTLAQWLDDKYPRVSQFYKPLIIVEFGVWDTPANKIIWLQDGFKAMGDGNYPLLKIAAYFNTQDSFSWKKWNAAGKPDWTVSPALFK
jgi:beta-mannanase